MAAGAIGRQSSDGFQEGPRAIPWEFCPLRERFDPSSKRELYLAELLGRKKRRGEDWATFAEDLKTLVDKAYPELQDDAKEQMALTHYLGQFEQQQLAFSVK